MEIRQTVNTEKKNVELKEIPHPINLYESFSPSLIFFLFSLIYFLSCFSSPSSSCTFLSLSFYLSSPLLPLVSHLLLILPSLSTPLFLLPSFFSYIIPFLLLLLLPHSSYFSSSHLSPSSLLQAHLL